MDDRRVFIDEVFDANGGLATRDQLLAAMNPKTLARHVKAGAIVRVWHGVYALTQPDLADRLSALELSTGRPIVACMHTAATLYGFGTEDIPRVHVLDPGVRMRPSSFTAAIQDVGYTVVPIVAPDIFRDQWSFVARLRSHLERAA